MTHLEKVTISIIGKIRENVRTSADWAVSKSLIEAQRRPLTVKSVPARIFDGVGLHVKFVREMLLSSCKIHVEQHNSTLKP